MAAKTFYIKDAAAAGSSHGSLQDGGVAPGTATTGTGWIVGKTAATNYSLLVYNSERLASTFGATALPNAAPTTTDCFRSENTITGSFSAAAWTWRTNVVAVTTGGSQDGRMRCRFWKSANADGSSAVEITASTSVASASLTNVSTTPNTSWTSTNSFTPGAPVVFDNEYLFWQPAWQIDGAGGGNGCDILIRTNSADSVLTTSDFTPSFTGTIGQALAPLAFTSDATETFSGSGSVAMAPLAISSDATETFSSSDTSVALSPLAISSSATETFSADTSIALAPLAIDAEGTVTEEEESFSGTIDFALSPLAIDATGTESFTGTTAVALAPLAIDATSTQTFQGSGSVALSALTFEATGTETYQGSASLAFATLAVDASGAETYQGSASLALAPLTVSGEATEAFSGSVTLALAPLASSSSGTETFQGTASVAISPLAISATGTSGDDIFTGEILFAFAALTIGSSGTVQAPEASSPFELSFAADFDGSSEDPETTTTEVEMSVTSVNLATPEPTPERTFTTIELTGFST